MVDSFSSTAMGAEQAQSAKEMAEFRTKMRALKNSLSGGPSEEEQLKEACKGFESVFISKLWKEMQNTIPKNDMFHSKMEKQYLSMFDKEFADKMTDNGGIGLADMMFDQLKDKLKNSSDSTLANRPVDTSLEKTPEVKPFAAVPEGLPLNKPRSATAIGFSADNGVTEELGQQTPPATVMDKVDDLARKIEEHAVNTNGKTNNSLARQADMFVLGRTFAQNNDRE